MGWHGETKDLLDPVLLLEMEVLDSNAGKKFRYCWHIYLTTTKRLFWCGKTNNKLKPKRWQSQSPELTFPKQEIPNLVTIFLFHFLIFHFFYLKIAFVFNFLKENWKRMDVVHYLNKKWFGIKQYWICSILTTKRLLLFYFIILLKTHLKKTQKSNFNVA